MYNPLFSIVIPTYNRIALFPRAIQSVIAQTYTNWELIIIDDGSIDGTQEYVNQINNLKVKYYYQENKGRSTARNIGIEKSIGEYVCFLDSDDELFSNYLSNFKNTINNRSDKLILSGVQLMDYKSKVKIIPNTNIPTCIEQCLEGNFNLMPFCFHKSLLKNHRFDKELFYGEDFHFLLPIIANNYITISTLETSIVHQHEDRTINKVFEDIPVGFDQLQRSVIASLEKYHTNLSNIIGEGKLLRIKIKKIQDFILTAAKYNYLESVKINKSNPSATISNFRLLFQRIKGIIQS